MGTRSAPWSRREIRAALKTVRGESTSSAHTRTPTIVVRKPELAFPGIEESHRLGRDRWEMDLHSSLRKATQVTGATELFAEQDSAVAELSGVSALLGLEH